MTPRLAERYEWRVRYRRRWWPHLVSRLYQSPPPARRLVHKLRCSWPDLEPVVELQVQRRRVAPWEDVSPGQFLIDVYQRRPIDTSTKEASR